MKSKWYLKVGIRRILWMVMVGCKIIELINWIIILYLLGKVIICGLGKGLRWWNRFLL